MDQFTPAFLGLAPFVVIGYGLIICNWDSVSCYLSTKFFAGLTEGPINSQYILG
jgi:hypothetical protein